MCSPHSTMPGIMPEQDNMPILNSQLKKRKRDLALSDAVIIPNTTKFIPTTPRTTNAPFCLDCPELVGDNGEFSAPQRCIPRKRRVLQQSYIHPQKSSIAQVKIISPNIRTSGTSNVPSPPVSPRTLVPSPHSQHNTCASASCLRPCHICHRRPTTKEVLDAYVDCDLCGERSCYICLRQCDAIHCSGSIYLLAESQLLKDASSRLQDDTSKNKSHFGQPRKICSCCAVEGVTETGIEVVRCLDCKQAARDHQVTFGR
ncbi:hypothetical protein BDV37DRAFT_276770 [Aspergillus pseudonomiae]|uniref:Uncharacterized protein n=1 Tax=Aspergillus pseudonomiae TaxID=1506151 RepID=A0A5N7CUH8_9EURO|nr:uncharacterized protein BDV37DRAFT_276770 [Aspergillus pseudonomiae]KAE8397629.1 hypothetical protein BDV37DRAFT_276770 [Aspergillus pseudonomiae]